MVSYYNSMYRQQPAPNGHFHQGNNHMHSWYPAGYHQGAQINAPPAAYLPQEEPQMWHHQHGHGIFPHNEFPDFVHTGIPPLQPHADPEHQLPSPPITLSGSSELSSPGGQSGNISPPQALGGNPRPPPARSPYEWIKKTSYQSQPNPGKTRTKDKYRVVYTDHQRIELEKEFTFVNRYITIRRKAELAATLGLSERQVKIWFQNRRAKERKQNKKRVEEKNQIELYSNINMQQVPNGMLSQQNPSNGVMNHTHINNGIEQQHHDNVLPTTVPPSTSVMQRFLQDQAMKLETDNSEQMG
ncbi:homeobox protein CHOX-CAD isoform X2 [Anthonomus grandis grandis]|nr:homeobox protein CHOX-CAD isoform X2 [Anthonomus grandis grandis]